MSRGATRPISRIVGALRDGRNAPRKERDTRKVSLILLISEVTLRELQGSAREAAGRSGLSTEDIAYGDFVAGHIGAALEEAYESSSDAPAEREPTRGKTVFVALRLSPAVARKLRRDVEQEAALARQHESREDFAKRRMGQRLDAAYRASASARS